MTADPTNPPSLRVLRLQAVLDRVGLGRSRLYDLVAERRFPAPVKLSDRAVGWFSHEVDEWIAARASQRVAHGTSE